ncbi:prolyl-tRNA synthetase associated domain-containing protein [Pararhodospirillum oryzae]|uniref:YbaK/aminoacyl-tRNA synthetase-associated domain-containing protein n=1 Tax=Pararhodospirillum oryzae TaxID=478448 RepID=A0A512H6S0_9PROT|nr:prolyl-tRNA synthetase associated domain-containing protein [Pararhodospirillum oryzae]GEO81165.1 hypothetical protein ROR02_12960 [Pararhodospirillum oryzae]
MPRRLITLVHFSALSRISIQEIRDFLCVLARAKIGVLAWALVSLKRSQALIPVSMDALLARLVEWGIQATTTTHEAVFTVAAAAHTHDAIPGVHCKNLFLKDSRGQLWLVVCPHDRPVDLKTLPARIGSGRLSFGKPALLDEVLGVIPGAVTPFALINDTEHRVKVVLDAWMVAQEKVNYHPLVNTATTTVSGADLVRFIQACGHEPVMIDLAP